MNDMFAQNFDTEYIQEGKTEAWEPILTVFGDLDGDGLDDAVAISGISTPCNLVWYKQSDSLHFSSPKKINFEDYCDDGSALIHDVNDDGFLDVISYSLYNLRVSINDGTGSFTDSTLNLDTYITPRKMFMKDFNGDLIDDVIIVDNDEIYGFPYLGGVSYGEEVSLGDYGTFKGIDMADMDGDGDNDIVGAKGSGSGWIFWIENLGDGVFDDINYYETTSYPKDIFLRDIDADSDIDIVYHKDNDLYWYENVGDWTFLSVTLLISNIPSYAGYTVVKDMNDDGLEDVAYVYDAFGDGVDIVKWNENLGDGSFSDLDTLVIQDKPGYLLIEDVNNDGEVDIITERLVDHYGTMISDDGFVLIYEGLGELNFDTQKFLNCKTVIPNSIAIADLNGDGFEDIAVSSEVDGKISWYPSVSGNSFAEQEWVTSELPGAREVIAFDVDLDDDIDLVAINRLNILGEFYDKLVWFENDMGTFGPMQIIKEDIDDARTISFGDIDGDGVNDILLSSVGTDDVWYKNLGGSFSDANDIYDNYSKSLTPFDVDQDGDLDVIHAGYFGGAGWVENLGDGIFGTNHSIGGGSYRKDLKMADLDGDGDYDAVLAYVGPGYDQGRISVYENDGDSNFDFIGGFVYSSYNYYPDQLELADLNDDGLIDIVFNVLDIYIAANEKTFWIENLGGLTFSDDEIVYVHDCVLTDLAIADLDHDGDMDVVTPSNEYHEVLWHNNDFYYNTTLKGRVFIDLNENLMHDSTDIGTTMIPIISDPINNYLFTDSTGHYELGFDHAFGSYEVYIDSIPYWSIVTDSISYTITSDEASLTVDSLDFGIYPDSIVYEVESDITDQPYSCNDTIQFWMYISNTGTTIASGYYCLELDNDLIYHSSPILPDSMIDNKVYWSFDSLLYFEDRVFTAAIITPGVDYIGDSLETFFHVSVEDSLGFEAFFDSDTLNQVLTCAYDPNDKSVTPGIDSLGYISPSTTELEYLIRFQNTGTDTAQNVLIVDQLDPNLNWATLDFVSASHSVDIDVSVSGEVQFLFNDIFLPDSNVNKQASNGFVKFKIDLINDLPLLTQLFNQAEIYFDLNPPIYTNTTINTIYSCDELIQNILIQNDTVCENKSFFASINDSLTTTQYVWEVTGIDTVFSPDLNWLPSVDGEQEIILNIENSYCSADTLLLIDIHPEYEIDLGYIEICEGDSVLIIGEYRSISGDYSDSLFSVYGCDSLVMESLIVHPKHEIELGLYEICEGDSILIHGEYRFVSEDFTDSLLTSFGCDSLLTESLIVHPKYEIDLGYHEICEGDSILIHDTYRSISGDYSDSLNTIYGCDSVLTESLIVHPKYEFDLGYHEICEGDSILILGEYRFVSGDYSDSLHTINGCDSLFVESLIVHPKYSVDLGLSNICADDSLLVFGSYQSAEGIYFDSLYTIYGCDSISYFEIIVDEYLPTIYHDSVTICEGESVNIYGVPQYLEGFYYDTLVAVGCDSVFATFLKVNPLPDVIITESIDTTCNYSDSLYLGGLPFNGIYEGLGVVDSVFHPNLAGIGLHLITYTFTDIYGCSDTDSLMVYVDECLGLYELYMTEIKVFPNPTQRKVTILLPSKEDLITYKLMDISGRLIESGKQSFTNTFEINLDGTPGLYILEVSTSKGVFNTRIVKE